MIGVQVRPDGAEWPLIATRPGSYFAHVFAPVLGEFAHLYWLADAFQSGPFVGIFSTPGGMEVVDGYRVPDQPDDVSLFRPGAIPALAPWMTDDDMTFVGLSPDDCDPIGVAQSWVAMPHIPYAEIEKHAQVCFFNEDGRSWEVYARDAELIQRVVAHVTALHGLAAIACELQRRDSELYRNWGVV